jgi:hypothetical protein
MSPDDRKKLDDSLAETAAALATVMAKAIATLHQLLDSPDPKIALAAAVELRRAEARLRRHTGGRRSAAGGSREARLRRLEESLEGL